MAKYKQECEIKKSKAPPPYSDAEVYSVEFTRLSKGKMMALKELLDANKSNASIADLAAFYDNALWREKLS